MVKLGPALKEWQEKNLEPLRYDYDLKSTDTVLDLGSYRGEFADEIIRRYGCHVERFDALDNRAAWTHDGHIEMGGQYYYTSAFDDTTTKRVYRCVDIKPYLAKEIALTKINIEGMEYELIRHLLDHDLMKQVRNLQVQFHLIDGRDSKKEWADIWQRLSLTHSLTWRTPFVWENWKRNEG